MDQNITRHDIKEHIKVERPRLYKVILINDDYTPREFCCNGAERDLSA